MHNRWEGLHTALVDLITTWQAVEQFQYLRSSATVFDRFESASQVLEYLIQRDGVLDDKDRVYEALVRSVQAGAPSSRLALSLLWGGLWPGLDRMYRHRVRFFRDDPDELTQEAFVAFATLVEQVDLERVHRLAATLVRSTERTVMRARRASYGEVARRVELVDPGERSTAAHRRDARAAALALDEMLEARTDATTTSAFAEAAGDLARQLEPVLGEDTPLVIAVLVGDEEHAVAGRRFGLSPAVARKRFQRALARLRLHLRELGLGAPNK